MGQTSVASGAANVPADTNRAECPSFTLRAGQRGHLQALMGTIDGLPQEERPQARLILREFELWEAAHR